MSSYPAKNEVKGKNLSGKSFLLGNELIPSLTKKCSLR